MATTLEEGGMEQQSSADELLSQMEKLVKAFDEVADRNDLPQGLAHIVRILSSNRDKQIISQLAEGGKMVRLAILLPKIDDVLKQCKARPSPVPAKPKQQQKKKMPSVSDCNPFKSRSSSSHDQGRQQGDDDQDAAAQPALSVEPLLQEAIGIFGDVPPPPPPPPNAAEAAEEVKYYEWTTSYVDETRIYGWDKEADDVVDALVGPRPPADQAENTDEKTAEADKKDANKDEKTAEADKKEMLFRAAGIVGIHGSGKTALAQKVFVHDRIKDAFPLRLWVCVGPPDSEDRAGLLYRMLDNLGLDTEKVEKIVNESKAVKDSNDKEKSKIGVLLFILHVTLHNTGYLIVFDDIRAYGKDDWYSNLTLRPPGDKEWFERLAYGLPKVKKSAVLVTCRKEDDARVMVRTGNVFRPPRLSVDDGWKLFEREYKRAKAELLVRKENGEGRSSDDVQEESKRNKKVEEKMNEIKLEEDKIYKVLGEMKEEIVDKCLGLPVAIIEAAKGCAMPEFQLPDDPQPEAETSKTEPQPQLAGETATSKTVDQAAQDEARQQDDQSA